VTFSKDSLSRKPVRQFERRRETTPYFFGFHSRANKKEASAMLAPTENPRVGGSIPPLGTIYRLRRHAGTARASFS